MRATDPFKGLDPFLEVGSMLTPFLLCRSGAWLCAVQRSLSLSPGDAKWGELRVGSEGHLKARFRVASSKWQ